MTSSEPRVVRILTVEPAGTPFAYPSVASDLPFLSFRLTGESEARYTKPSTRLRTYEYAVECKSPPPRGTITGSAYVISPWDTSHIASLNVYAPDRRRLRVTPSRIVVEKQRFDPDSTIAQLLVTTSEVEAKTRIRVIASEQAPFVVEKIESKGTESFVSYKVRLVRDRDAAGTYEISITDPMDGDTTVVPVTLTAANP